MDLVIHTHGLRTDDIIHVADHRGTIHDLIVTAPLDWSGTVDMALVPVRRADDGTTHTAVFRAARVHNVTRA